MQGKPPVADNVSQPPLQKVAFDNPPVVETFLSVQFALLPGFTAAHAGCFWQLALHDEQPDGPWKNAKLYEVIRAEDVFEDMGSEIAFRAPALQLLPANAVSRVQIVKEDRRRMIQIQDSRFIYNWRKGGGTYASFETIKTEFDILFGRFQQYVVDAGFPAPEPNQWEVCYINHVRKGPLWTTPSDWHKIFPGLYVPSAQPDRKVTFETTAGFWQYRLATNRGRLHVSLQHMRDPEAPNDEILSAQMLARGPINADQGLALESGFALGHESIVNTFREMSSQTARSEWQEIVDQ